MSTNQIVVRITREKTCWSVFVVVKVCNGGWRQIGYDLSGFIDDFGEFIPFF